MEDRKSTTMNQAEAARHVLPTELLEEGIIPGPMPPTLFRSVGVMAVGTKFIDHFIEVVLPLQVDVSRIPAEIHGVRVVVTHEDRHWIAIAT